MATNLLSFDGFSNKITKDSKVIYDIPSEKIHPVNDAVFKYNNSIIERYQKEKHKYILENEKIILLLNILTREINDDYICKTII